MIRTFRVCLPHGIMVRQKYLPVKGGEDDLLEFGGFNAATFAAFEESKWASHAYNRERLEVKLTLSALGRKLLMGLEHRLASLGGELSDERPSVFNDHRVDCLSWYGLREGSERELVERNLSPAPSLPPGAAAQSPADRHLHLLLRLDGQGLLAGMRLPAAAQVDRGNALKVLALEKPRARLQELLSELPGDVALAWLVGAEAEWLPPERVWQLADELQHDQPRELLLGRRLHRAGVEQAGAGLAATLEDLFLELAPLYELLAWSRDNDMLGLVGQIKKRRRQAASRLQVGVEVRILSGLAAGRTGVIEALRRKGEIQVRLGNLVLTMPASEVERTGRGGKGGKST